MYVSGLERSELKRLPGLQTMAKLQWLSLFIVHMRMNVLKNSKEEVPVMNRNEEKCLLEDVSL
jgi:hypothetical protein